MDPFVKKVKWVRSPLVGVAIGVVVIAGTLMVGWIALRFTSYKKSGGIPSEDTSPSQVSISNPQSGGQFEAGESLTVEAIAVGPNEYLSMELWLDGKLVGVQASPGGGMHPFSTHFSWLPLEPGSHSLIAGAVDSSGQKTMSAQVIVLITPNESGIEISTTNQDGRPVILPAPPEGENNSPSAPGADASTGPAENWSGSPGNWINSVTVGEKPAAPELVVSGEQCAANIQIHDLSNNEEGFVLYRQTPNSPTWLKVAALSSQSQFDWIEYTDQGISGAISYYVSSFNSQGESKSNLALVNINPENCGAEIERTSVGSVDLTLKIPNQHAGRVYCYQSTDGVNWARWPALGFLSPDQDGFVRGGPVIQVLLNRLEDQPSYPLLGIFMECWGWQDGILVQLGDFFIEEIGPQYPQSESNHYEVGEGLSVDVIFEQIQLGVQSEFYPIGPEGNLVGDYQMNPIQFRKQLLTPISPDIPRFYLSLTTDPEECGNHLPPDAQNFLGQLLYCFPYPEYDPSKGGTIPQPYLVWAFDLSPNCLGGYTEECKSYFELLALAEENGGQVGFELMAFSSAGKHVWSVTEPNLTMFVEPPLTCAGDIQFNVRLWYQPGNKGVSVSASPDNQITEIGEQNLILPPNDEVFYGPYSNPVSTPCLPLQADIGSEILITQYLDITFESLELFEIDDGDNDGTVEEYTERVELYGYFRVIAPSMGQLIEEHCFFPEFGTCDDNEEYIAYRRRFLNLAEWGTSEKYAVFNPGSTHVLPSGFYELKDKGVCQSTNKYGCLYEGQSTSYKYNNNTIRVFVTVGDSLSLEVRLIDYDNASDDDIVCIAEEMTPNRTLEQWANVQDEVYMLYGEMTQSGRCTVKAVINAVNP